MLTARGLRHGWTARPTLGPRAPAAEPLAHALHSSRPPRAGRLEFGFYMMDSCEEAGPATGSGTGGWAAAAGGGPTTDTLRSPVSTAAATEADRLVTLAAALVGAAPDDVAARLWAAAEVITSGGNDGAAQSR